MLLYTRSLKGLSPWFESSLTAGPARRSFLSYPVNLTKPRIRNSDEIDEIVKKEDIVRFIKVRRIDWMGYVERIDANKMPRKLV
jgi:hypothetical protein